MHWLLDIEFKDDRSRYRTGHGAKNMAVAVPWGSDFGGRSSLIPVVPETAALWRDPPLGGFAP
jgi:hypothetical protein